MNLFTKQKQTHRHRKQTYDYQRGNLEKSPKLETIDKYNEFIKEKQFYKITSNTIVLLEAVKKIEQS